MIIIGLVIQALLCGAILYREVLRKRCLNFATSIFFAAYAVLYIAEPLVLHCFFGGVRSISVGSELFRDPTYFYIFNLLGIALVGAGLLVSLWRRERVPSEAGADVPMARWRWVTDLLGVLVIAAPIAFVSATGESVSDLLQASRFSWFESGSFRSGYNVASAYLLAFAAPQMFLVSIRAPHSRLLFVLSLLAGIAYCVLTKDRKWLFFIASGWLAAKYVKAGYRLILTRRVVALGSIGFSVILLSQFLRDAVPRYLLGQEIDFSAELHESLSRLFEYSDLSYFYRASIEAIGQHVDNGYWIALGLVRRILFFFLPTSYSAGLKVEDMSAMFSDVVGGGDDIRRGSMPPGLFGSLVLSFGWVASFVIAPLLAWGLARLDQAFRRPHGGFRLAALTVYLASVVFAFRGDESTAFYHPVTNGLLLSALMIVFRVLPRSRFA